MRRVVILLVLLVCASAHAEKKRRIAQGLAGGGAAVSGAVVLAGFVTAPDATPVNKPVMYTGLGMLFVTPSLGHFYSGQYLTWGMGIRAAATGLAIATLETQYKYVQCDDAMSSNDPPCKVLGNDAIPLLGVAAIAFIGGVWWDTLDAGDAADRYNRDHGVTIQPSVQTTAQTVSAGISGTF